MFFQVSQSSDAQSGWFCTCGYRIIPEQPAERSIPQSHKALGERRAKAFRKSMKERARAQRLLKKSAQLAARRRRGQK